MPIFTPSVNKSLSINEQTASYILVAGDADSKVISMNVASANTLTIPPNSSVPFPIGTQILATQTGAGQVTVTPGPGVTLRSAGGALKSRVQYSALGMVKVASDTWLVFGDITT
jgi:hypothetical protein